MRDETSLPPDFAVRDFQHDVADSDSFLTLARAGCGSGKSLAAYMWARNWCVRFDRGGRTNFRLFFCLPMTGTTTEHFKDYALESGIDASLTHSRAHVDLKAIAETAPQEEAARTMPMQPNPHARRLMQNATRSNRWHYGARHWWDPQAEMALGLMSNARRSIYSLPSIMSGTIVFDEIHAFDDQMFGHLLVFLKNFPRLPVLLMTASLPENAAAPSHLFALISKSFAAGKSLRDRTVSS